jgi:acetyl esterase/lipase
LGIKAVRKRLLILLLVLGSGLQPLLAQVQPVILLYAGPIPDSRPSDVQEMQTQAADGSPRTANVVTPTLTVFQPAKKKATGTAIVLCPGGGYTRLVMEREGREAALRLNEMGLTVFLLKYRLPNDLTQPDKTIAPLLDAQQAIRLVRERAAEFGVRPDRIGIMGFSAGGHLAATAATHFARPVGDNAAATSVRPDFAVLVYPVISFADSLMHPGSRKTLLGPTPAPAQVQLYSNELQVSTATPPTFLVHAADDKVVKVQNSMAFYLACVHHGVPAEMHLYPKGGHGFGINNKAVQDNWTERLHSWLATNGWLGR